MPTRKVDESPVYQLKVTLKGSKPPIWRRIQVRGSTTLPKLHAILQIVMGWTDSHLHQFMVGDIYYGIPDPDWDLDIKSERRIKVGEIVSAVKDRFVYEYDFGDSWEHEIVVEKVLPPEPGVRYPVCLTGKRACPPEDVGGLWGYAEFVEAIGDPKHPEHADMLTWVGGREPLGRDPLAFDVDAVNQGLKYL
jgi:hypothetical protein